jgi:GT2 family glycosyltransferase
MTIDDVTGLCVVYKYKDLIEKAYTSIRSFHPEMKILIIDGSSPEHDCHIYLDRIVDDNIKVYHSGYNIGHGRGLHFGITQIDTPLVLTFDSDIVMTKSPLQAMCEMMEDNTYGVGYIEKTDLWGFDYGAVPRHMSKGWMRYLHPYFSLLQLKEYYKFPPYIHHGAPWVQAALSIYRKRLSDKVIKEFPGLGHSSGTGFSWVSAPREYIQHDVASFGSTGRRRIKEGLPHIDGQWEKLI